MTLDCVEARLIRQALLKCTSNRAAAPDILGISGRALQDKIIRHRLQGLGKRQREMMRASGPSHCKFGSTQILP